GLDGTLPPVQPGTPISRQAAVAAAAPAPANQSSVRLQADLGAGQRTYQQACVFCHGTDGKGDHGGASIVAVTDLALATQTVTAGRNNMPAFKTTLSPDEIRDVTAYVVRALGK